MIIVLGEGAFATSVLEKGSFGQNARIGQGEFYESAGHDAFVVGKAVQPGLITLHGFDRFTPQIHNAKPAADQVASGSLGILPLAFESMGVRNVIRIHSGHPFGLGFGCRTVGGGSNSLMGSFQNPETWIPDGFQFLKGSISRSIVGDD